MVANDVPAMLVQIRANEQELRRRVDCFVQQKREEINHNNVQDFIEPANDDEMGATAAMAQSSGDMDDTDVNGDGIAHTNSCARVRSSVYRSKNASSHLQSE